MWVPTHCTNIGRIPWIMSKEVSTCLLVFTHHNSICQEEYDETEHYILIMAHVGTRHRQIEYSSPHLHTSTTANLRINSLLDNKQQT